MVKNVARCLQVAHRLDVPFYLGADEPLLGDPIDAAFVSAAPWPNPSMLLIQLYPLV